DKEADEDHPYGHGRIETLMTVGIGVLLIAVAIGISIDAIGRLFHPEGLSQPSVIVLFAALLSIFSKEGLYHYTLAVANCIRSNLLRANAWHHRTDALSSVVVLVGVAGTLAGLEYLDAIAAVGVSLMVAKAGVELAWESIQELIDTGLGEVQLETISQEILQVEGVRAMHRLRTRRMGASVLVDVHIMVNPRLSVSEGHFIADHVELTLYKQIDDVTDVTVHIDPENDEQTPPCHSLPMRNELIPRLKQCWREIPERQLIEDFSLHYLNGELDLEVWIPLHKVASKERAEELSEQFNHCMLNDPQIKRVRAVFF
ncbi:MAG: cation transporter, partial [Gammaproteobacteria bacterium]|nr:cation transporter [Gammaproteobacteria bacterium]